MHQIEPIQIMQNNRIMVMKIHGIPLEVFLKLWSLSFTEKKNDWNLR